MKKTSVYLGIILTLLLAPCTKAADPTAYVSSSVEQGFLTSFNPASGALTKLGAAGVNAEGFVVSPDGSTAYVSVGGAISAVNLATGKISGSINVSGGVESSPVLSADGSLLYFVGATNVFIVSTETFGVVVQIGIVQQACPCGLAVTPGGTEIYEWSLSGVQAFNGQTYQPITISSLPAGGTFESLALSPEGSKLYVVTIDTSTLVSVVDTLSNAVVATIPPTGEGYVLGAAVSPDGETLYLSGGRGLTRISTATNTVLDQISAPALSGHLTPSPDGQYVYLNRGPADSAVPGLLRFSVDSATVQSLAVGGPAIAEQIPAPGGPVYVLQAVYNVGTEDLITQTLTQGVGLAGGTQALIASSSGNVVAGVSGGFTSSTLQPAIVSTISTATRKVTSQFTYSPPAGDTVSPYSFALNSAGTLGYIGFNDPGAKVGSQTQVAVIDLPTGSVKQTFPIGTGTGFTSYGVRFLYASPDGSTLLSLASVSSDELCSTSVITLRTSKCVSLGIDSAKYGPLNAVGYSFAVSADGTRVYIPVFESEQVIGSGAAFLIEVDPGSMTILRQLQIPDVTAGPPPTQALGVLYSSATSSVYLLGFRSFNEGSAIARVDLGTYTVAVIQPLNYPATDFAITPDGSQLLVTGSTQGTQIFDGTTLAPVGSIAGGQQQAIVIPPQ